MGTPFIRSSRPRTRGASIARERVRPVLLFLPTRPTPKIKEYEVKETQITKAEQRVVAVKAPKAQVPATLSPLAVITRIALEAAMNLATPSRKATAAIEVEYFAHLRAARKT